MTQAIYPDVSAIRLTEGFRQLMRVILPAAALLCAGVLTLPALAQDKLEDKAVISAQGIKPVVPGARIRFRLADDSDFNRQLADVAVSALRNAGYASDDTAPQITLRMETFHSAASAAPDNSIGSLQADSGGDVDLNVRLWSNSKNSLLNKKPGETEGPAHFVIVLEAYDEAAEAVSWHAEARTDNRNATRVEAGSAMVQQLISVFGKASEPVFIQLP